MAYFTHQDILALERSYRINLMNGASGFRPAVLVGTVNEQGQTNLAMFNSCTHIGANPPLMGLLLRPPAAKQDTRTNILSSGQFSINAVTQSIYRVAHETASKTWRGQSEFETCGFTPGYFKDFNAPYVDESPIRIGLDLVEVKNIECNGTTLVIGQVQHLQIADALLDDDGHLRPDQADMVSCCGLDTYYLPQFIDRVEDVSQREPR